MPKWLLFPLPCPEHKGTFLQSSAWESGRVSRDQTHKVWVPQTEGALEFLKLIHSQPQVICQLQSKHSYQLLTPAVVSPCKMGFSEFGCHSSVFPLLPFNSLMNLRWFADFLFSTFSCCEHRASKLSTCQKNISLILSNLNIASL